MIAAALLASERVRTQAIVDKLELLRVKAIELGEHDALESIDRQLETERAELEALSCAD